MAKVAGYQAKRRFAATLLNKADFLMLAETHSTAAGSSVFAELPGTTSWWSAGSAQRAGVGIIVQNAFLKQFAGATSEWTELDPGRLAMLTLSGTCGTVQLVTG